MGSKTNEKVVVNSKVKYSSKFLKSIGIHTGNMPKARGLVTTIQNIGSLSLASINWDRSDIPGKVNVKNLQVVKTR